MREESVQASCYMVNNFTFYALQVQTETLLGLQRDLQTINNSINKARNEKQVVHFKMFFVFLQHLFILTPAISLNCGEFSFQSFGKFTMVGTVTEKITMDYKDYNSNKSVQNPFTVETRTKNPLLGLCLSVN